MNKTYGRARELAACVASVAAFGVAFSGTAFAATTMGHQPQDRMMGPGAAALHDSGLGPASAASSGATEHHSFSVPTKKGPGHDRWHNVPGSSADSDIDRNYHDELKPESSTNSKSEYSLAQCGSDDDRYISNTSQCGDRQYRRDHSRREERGIERKPYDPNAGYGGSSLGTLF